jgi:hypothetical protein
LEVAGANASRHTILRNITSTAAIDTAVLLSFQYTAERLCNEVSLECVQFGSTGGWVTGCDGESVDELEDEESGESAAEVADAVKGLIKLFRQSKVRNQTTYVARRVM